MDGGQNTCLKFFLTTNSLNGCQPCNSVVNLVVCNKKPFCPGNLIHLCCHSVRAMQEVSPMLCYDTISMSTDSYPHQHSCQRPTASCRSTMEVEYVAASHLLTWVSTGTRNNPNTARREQEEREQQQNDKRKRIS